MASPWREVSRSGGAGHHHAMSLSRRLRGPQGGDEVAGGEPEEGARKQADGEPHSGHRRARGEAPEREGRATTASPGEHPIPASREARRAGGGPLQGLEIFCGDGGGDLRAATRGVRVIGKARKGESRAATARAGEDARPSGDVAECGRGGFGGLDVHVGSVPWFGCSTRDLADTHKSRYKERLVSDQNPSLSKGLRCVRGSPAVRTRPGRQPAMAWQDSAQRRQASTQSCMPPMRSQSAAQASQISAQAAQTRR